MVTIEDAADACGHAVTDWELWAGRAAVPGSINVVEGLRTPAAIALPQKAAAAAPKASCLTIQIYHV